MIKQIQYQYISKLTLLITRMLKYAENLLPVEDNKNHDDPTHEDFVLESAVDNKPLLNIHNIEQDFMSELNRLFSRLIPTKGTRLSEHDLHIADLTLLAEEELQENIVIDGIVSRTNANTELQIKLLSQRLTAVVPDGEIARELNPFLPRNICKSFQHAIQNTSLTSKQRIYLYERFENVVLFELEEIFKNINEQMKSAGIMAELTDKPKVVRTKSIERPRYDDKNHRVKHVEEKKDDDLLSALKGLMQQSASNMVQQSQVAMPTTVNQTANIPVSQSSPEEVNQQTLLQALNQMQKMQTEIASLSVAQKQVGIVKRRVASKIQTANPHEIQSLGVDNESVIDIVSMIFDFIFDDHNLPDDFKVLLGRLQIPIIKVALIDPSFMEMGQHPARQLLNQMAHACVGWNENQGTGLKEKITEIVNRLVNEFDQDTQLIDEMLKEFVEFYETHNHRVTLLEKRLKEAEEGKALQEQARNQATTAIEKIKAGYQLPERVEKFLDEDWYNLMTLAFLREGRSSMMWQQHLDTGIALVKSLSPIRSQSDRAIHKLKSAELVSQLRQGLDILGQDEFDTRGLFSDLNKLHDNVRDGMHVISARQETEEIPDPEELEVDLDIVTDAENDTTEQLDEDIEEIDITDDAEQRKEDEALEEFLTLVATFHAGLWFTRHNEQGEIRCKLAAVITTVGKYIFVNNAGRKVDEYTKVNLAKALRDKTLVQLDDGALFERALKKIVTNFKERQYQTDKEWQ